LNRKFLLLFFCFFVIIGLQNCFWGSYG
jgi:hypothetical protein